MKAFYESRSEPMFIGKMTTYPYPLHVHEICEVACVLTGECNLQIGETLYTLKPGDIAYIFPIVPHSFESVSEDIDGFAAFFPADTISEFSTTFQTLLPDEPVLRRSQLNDEVYRTIDKLLADCTDAHSPLRLAYLHLFMAETLSMMRFHSAGSYNERGLAGRVVRYVYDHACENISLASTAEGLGISTSHLSHLFSQQFKINFRRFVNAIRIDKAKMMMRDPRMTLNAICEACGFENIRTFRRAFVSQTGMLPSTNLQKIREEAGADASEALSDDT